MARRATHLRIPVRHRAVLQKLAKLPAASRRKLLAALSAELSTLSVERTADGIAVAVPSLAEDAHDLVDALIALTKLSRFYGWSHGRLAEELVRTGDLKLVEKEARGFVSTLVDLLQTPGMAQTAKAIDLLTEEERVFTDARLITDLRPVFGDDPTEVVGSLVVHRLRVDYVQGTEMRSFHVGLDDLDLERLRTMLDRERGKSDALKTLLARAGVRYFEVEEEEEEG